MQVRDGIAYQRIGDTYIAVRVDVGNMVFLNETGGLILALLDKGKTKQEVIQELCNHYQVDEAVVTRDVNSVTEELMSLGFLIREGATEIEIVRQPIDQQTDPRIAIRNYCEEKNIPLLALIEVTDACNLRCTHCYIPFENLRRIRELEHHRQLGFDEYKRLLDELRELGCFEVVFTGGEPATYHQLTDLCEYARNLRFSVSIKTNAALLDDDTIARLRQLHITEVQTSLYSMKPEVHDGITRSKGSWAATTTALQEMYSAGQRLRLACVVMQSNFQHLSGLRAFARTINAPISFDLIVQARTDGSCGSVSERLLSSQLKWLDETGVFRNEIFVGSNPQVKPGDEVGYGMTRYLPKDPDSRVCGAANTLIAINPTGTVFPCVSFNLPLGNIRNTPLQTILTNQTSNRLRSYRNRSFEECKRCQLEEACPRCMATNYAEKGHPLSRVNYVCEVAYWMSKYAATQPG